MGSVNFFTIFTMSRSRNCKFLVKSGSRNSSILFLQMRVFVTTPTQPQLNSKVGVNMKMTLHHHHHYPPPTTTTNSMSSISQLFLTQFWPNFKSRFVESTTIITTTTTTWTTKTTTTTATTITRAAKAIFHFWPDLDQTFNGRFLG